VIRDGSRREIPVADLVAGDLVDLRPGDQLVADGVVRASTGLEADELLLTGESEPVAKRPGDRLLSGSFVVAGAGVIRRPRWAPGPTPAGSPPKRGASGWRARN
jgi:cation-transporting ATPase E